MEVEDILIAAERLRLVWPADVRPVCKSETKPIQRTMTDHAGGQLLVSSAKPDQNGRMERTDAVNHQDPRSKVITKLPYCLVVETESFAVDPRWLPVHLHWGWDDDIVRSLM